MNLIDIKDYEGLYSFDLNTNQIWSHKYNKYLKPRKINKVYYSITLTKNYKQKNFYLHRLIYQYNNLDTDITNLKIDHIDRNPLNNNIENLRTCNISENSCNKKRIKSKSTYSHIIITKYNTYQVKITKNNIKYRKNFKILDDAIKWRDEMKVKLHKEFANFD